MIVARIGPFQRTAAAACLGVALTLAACNAAPQADPRVEALKRETERLNAQANLADARVRAGLAEGQANIVEGIRNGTVTVPNPADLKAAVPK